MFGNYTFVTYWGYKCITYTHEYVHLFSLTSKGLVFHLKCPFFKMKVPFPYNPKPSTLTLSPSLLL
jgi:hypothetical protein